MLTMVDTQERITVLEAADRLRLRGSEVYRLIFSGEIDGRPVPGRGVLVSVESLERWRRLRRVAPGGRPDAH
jgi:excisionase family DNA binding protein